jgi:hypothetical protein
VGVGNLRGFCLWGVEPSNASLVCWKTAMGPENCKDMAEEMGLNGRRWRFSTRKIHGEFTM